ncbi:MAG: hypothetical protein ACJ74U_15140 [Jatrophihabitantaceae bacterium]
MTDDIGRDRSASPGDTPGNWKPTLDQPWRPVHPDQIIYLFDDGQPWCEGRHFHPQHQPGGYPGLSHHPTECQSYGGWFEGWFEDARAGLNGPPGFLNCYLARPFRYGQRRFAADDEDRLAIEFLPREDGTAEPFRCSIPASTIRNLAAHLNLTADVGDGWRGPRKVRTSLTDE